MNKYWILTAIIFSLTGVAAMGPGHGLKIVDRVSGHSLRAIQVAQSSFNNRGLNLDDYKVTVMEIGSSVIVLYEDKDTRAGQRGSSTSKPSYEVELRNGSLELIRENFSR